VTELIFTIHFPHFEDQPKTIQLKAGLHVIYGDSGVGKSEMLAALILKWLNQNLPGIRSIKMIAGDMFHVFRDREGNLYGIF